jgi:hypothetical protein
MTHSMIRRFRIEGVLAGDANTVKAREMYEGVLDDQMREQGYVPIFDVRPTWFTEYSVESESYAFVLVMHGVHVGEEKVWTIEGISEGKELPKPTAPAKSKPSSETLE